jgi:hypothetical protein
MTKKQQYVIDPRGERIEVEEVVIPGIGNGKPKLRTKVDSFVKIPMAWKDRLFEVGARNTAAIMIGIELHALSFKAFGKPFPLTNITMEKLGIDRHTKRPVLTKLEALELIKVEWRVSKSPLITVLNYAPRHR